MEGESPPSSASDIMGSGEHVAGESCSMAHCVRGHARCRFFAYRFNCQQSRGSTHGWLAGQVCWCRRVCPSTTQTRYQLSAKVKLLVSSALSDRSYAGHGAQPGGRQDDSVVKPVCISAHVAGLQGQVGLGSTAQRDRCPAESTAQLLSLPDSIGNKVVADRLRDSTLLCARKATVCTLAQMHGDAQERRVCGGHHFAQACLEWKLMAVEKAPNGSAQGQWSF